MQRIRVQVEVVVDSIYKGGGRLGEQEGSKRFCLVPSHRTVEVFSTQFKDAKKNTQPKA